MPDNRNLLNKIAPMRPQGGGELDQVAPMFAADNSFAEFDAAFAPGQKLFKPATAESKAATTPGQIPGDFTQEPPKPEAASPTEGGATPSGPRSTSDWGETQAMLDRGEIEEDPWGGYRAKDKAPDARPTENEQYAISGGWAGQIPKDKIALKGLNEVAEFVLPGLETGMAALAALPDTVEGIVNRAGAMKWAPHVLPLTISHFIREAIGVNDVARELAKKSDINGITANYLQRLEVMRISGNRTDQMDKLKPEEREALRTGYTDKALGWIENKTGGRVAVDPGAKQRLLANFGGGVIGSAPLMLAGAAVGGAIGTAMAGNATLGVIGSAMTGSRILGPALAKMGVSTASEAASMLANIIGSQGATAMEALFEAGSVYQDVIKNGGSHEDASRAFDKTYAGNVALLSLSNNLGQTGRLVRNMVKVGKIDEATAIVKSLIRTEANKRPLKAGAQAILQAELPYYGKKAGKAAKTVGAMIGDGMVEGFEEQSQKAVSEMATKGLEYTWENFRNEFIKNYDEGVLGGLIAVATGGGTSYVERRDQKAHDSKVREIMQRNKEYADLVNSSYRTEEFSSQPAAGTKPVPSATLYTGINSGTSPTRTSSATFSGQTTVDPNINTRFVSTSNAGSPVEERTVPVVPPAAATPAENPAAVSQPTATTTPAGAQPTTPAEPKPIVAPNTKPIILRTDITQINSGNGVDLSALEADTTRHNNPVTSRTAANAALANVLRPFLYGTRRDENGNITNDDEAAIENLINGFHSTNGVNKVIAGMLGHGYDGDIAFALAKAAEDVLKAGGTLPDLPWAKGKEIEAGEMAKRNMEFARALATRLAEAVNNKGVEAPDWMRAAAERARGVVAPGSKYDNVYHLGLGKPVRAAVAEHVSTPPIVKPTAPKPAAPKPNPKGQTVEEVLGYDPNEIRMEEDGDTGLSLDEELAALNELGEAPPAAPKPAAPKAEAPKPTTPAATNTQAPTPSRKTIHTPITEAEAKLTANKYASQERDKSVSAYSKAFKLSVDTMLKHGRITQEIADKLNKEQAEWAAEHVGQTMAEASKGKATVTEAPKVDAPKVDAPKAEASKPETPKEAKARIASEKKAKAAEEKAKLAAEKEAKKKAEKERKDKEKAALKTEKTEEVTSETREGSTGTEGPATQAGLDHAEGAGKNASPATDEGKPVVTAGGGERGSLLETVGGIDDATRALVLNLSQEVEGMLIGSDWEPEDLHGEYLDNSNFGDVNPYEEGGPLINSASAVTGDQMAAIRRQVDSEVSERFVGTDTGTTADMVKWYQNRVEELTKERAELNGRQDEDEQFGTFVPPADSPFNNVMSMTGSVVFKRDSGLLRKLGINPVRLAMSPTLPLTGTILWAAIVAKHGLEVGLGMARELGFDGVAYEHGDGTVAILATSEKPAVTAQPVKDRTHIPEPNKQAIDGMNFDPKTRLHWNPVAGRWQSTAPVNQNIPYVKATPAPVSADNGLALVPVGTKGAKNTYFEKDSAKALQANQYIGRGSAMSSTQWHADTLPASVVNTGTYTPDSIVLISSEGKRTGRVSPDFDLIQKALDAGATIVTDKPEDRARDFNVGEREVAKYLMSKGYVEKPGTGLWAPKGVEPKVVAPKGKSNKVVAPVPAPKMVTVKDPRTGVSWVMSQGSTFAWLDAPSAMSRIWVRQKNGVLTLRQKPITTIEHGNQPVQGPRMNAEIISDEMDQMEAMINAVDIDQNNHITTSDLMRLADEFGVTISGEMVRPLLNRIDAENGTTQVDNWVTPPSIESQQRGESKEVRSDVIGRFVKYLNAGGFAELINSLAYNGGQPADTGFRRDLENTDKPPTAGDIGAASLSLDTDKVNTEQVLEAFKSLVRNNSKNKDYQNNLYAISRAMAKSPTTHAELKAVVAAVMATLRPDYFSVSPERLDAMKKREMKYGAYNSAEDVDPKVIEKELQRRMDMRDEEADSTKTPEEMAEIRANELDKVYKWLESKRTPVLHPYFTARAERLSGFAPSNDVYEDAKLQYQERLSAGHTPERYVAEPERDLPYWQAREWLVGALGERGILTHENLRSLGIQYGPKPRHATTHQARVDEILQNQDLSNKVVFAVGSQGLKFLTGGVNKHMRGAYRYNGYATLMLDHFTGRGRKPFTLADPTATSATHYSQGEQLVLQLNVGSVDGYPVASEILSPFETSILLDQFNPMYNATLDRIYTMLADRVDILFSGTPHRVVTIKNIKDGSSGRVLIPLVDFDNSGGRFKTVGGSNVSQSVESGDAEGGELASHLPDDGTKTVAMRILARESIFGSPAERVQRSNELYGFTPTDENPALTPEIRMRLLSESTGKRVSKDPTIGEAERLIVASALDAVAAYAEGNTVPLNALSGVPQRLAVAAISSKKRLGQLTKIAETGEASPTLGITGGGKPMLFKQAVADVLEVANSDVPLARMFNGRNVHGIIPAGITHVSPHGARNKAQIIKAYKANVAFAGPTKTASMAMLAVLERLDPLFFERLGIEVTSDPEIESGVFDTVSRLIKLSSELKNKVTPSQVARTLIHEIGHSFDAHMSLPMLRAIDTWRQSEVEIYKKKHPFFAAVMDSPVANNNIIEDGTVGEFLNAGGSTLSIQITPEAVAELLAAFPERKGEIMELVKPLEFSGKVYAYSLSRGFAEVEGRKGYRYLSRSEYVAETFVDALMEEAGNRQRAYAGRGERKTVRSEDASLKHSPSAKAAMDAAHLAMGRMLNAVAGKTVLRRFFGYITAQTNLEAGRRAGDIAAPMAKLADPYRRYTNIYAAGPMDLMPELMAGPVMVTGKKSSKDLAKAINLGATYIGAQMRPVRNMFLSHMNATSVSGQSRATGYALREVLGELGLSYQSISSILHDYYKHADTMSQVDWRTAHRIAGIAEKMNTPNGLMGTTVLATDPKGGGQYWVALDKNGRYVDCMPKGIADSISDFEANGKFTGELAGMEKVVEGMNNLLWSRLKVAIANLAEELQMPENEIVEIEGIVKKITNYYPHIFTARSGDMYNRDAGLSHYNSGLDPAVDFGLNAPMLMKRTHPTMNEALKAGNFPMHTNAVDNYVSGMSNTLNLIARLDAMARMLKDGQAVPRWSREANAWTQIRAKQFGMPEELFGKHLQDIRMHPDSARVLEYAFRPNPYANSQVTRDIMAASGVATFFQLFGLNDYINGIHAVGASVLGLSKEEKEARRKYETSRGANSKWVKVVKSTLPGVAMLLGGAAIGAATGLNPWLSGAIGAATLMTLTTLLNKIPKITMAARDVNAVGRSFLNLVQSERSVAPGELSQRERERLAAAKIANIKYTEGLIQVERARRMMSISLRQGGFVPGLLRAAMYGVLNVTNRPQQINDNNMSIMSGKLVAKVGGFIMWADRINDKYRLPNGEVDVNNPEYRESLIRLSDDLDNQVGAIQSRNLFMNPTTLANAQLIMRAAGFRLTTEKMKVMVAGDIINNLGMHGFTGKRKPWTEPYYMMRDTYRGGGVLEPGAWSGDEHGGEMWNWRPGTVALASAAVITMAEARIESMASRLIWPNQAGYTQSEHVQKIVNELVPAIGNAPANAIGGMLSFVPPEGSSINDAMKHIVLDLLAPQFGVTEPSTGRVKRIIPPGMMYLRNFLESPIYLGIKPTYGGLPMFDFAGFFSPTQQWNAATNWAKSGLSPVWTILSDLSDGKDALGRSIGWGDPLRNVKWAKEWNEWAAGDPLDSSLTSAEKRIARSFAHVVSSAMFPLGVRELDQMMDVTGFGAGGNWATGVAQFFGGRALPPTSTMSYSETLAYNAAVESIRKNANPSPKDAEKANLLRPARTEIINSNGRSMGRLIELQLAGIITKTEFNKTYNDLVDPLRKTVRPVLIRFLRQASDKHKEVWKECYVNGTPKERAQIMDALTMELIGKSKSPQAKLELLEIRENIIKWQEDHK